MADAHRDLVDRRQSGRQGGSPDRRLSRLAPGW
jgi:hypothetical protein